ncbi:hypothetical protein HMI54_005896 [Coelomomyces lativittatus]|nr:hypothetical protein HMI56_003443 [Coelomomyces lativittatus]KAJ1505503.1 hypothetical protein HMI54_005896 [Coelomomyces lativittatus]KAJ1513634.1 hypothetical protein HMI55_005363 [Coelomomyces lativittatus]
MASLQVNPRGIPKAPFVDNVENFIQGSVEQTLEKFQEMLSKYRFMESNFQRRQASLKSKIPEISKTLETIETLMKQKERGCEEFEVDFELNDTLYTKASIQTPSTVYLWLGASIMAEYPTDEAKTFLQEKMQTALNSSKQVEEDLEFLQDQITTMEVNIARVYNWDVKKRKASK